MARAPLGPCAATLEEEERWKLHEAFWIEGDKLGREKARALVAKLLRPAPSTKALTSADSKVLPSLFLFL